jgi:cyclopropane fatty-acyl-phospholipid synthase-like methyltransferase
MLTEFLDHIKSFALARALMTAIELDIFQHLEEAPLSRSDLKQRLAIPDTPIADAFLDVLVAFQILGEENGSLVLLPLGRSVLPMYESIQSWGKEMQLFYSSLNDLTGLLRSGRYKDSVLSEYWAYKKSPERKKLQGFGVDEYSSVMDASQVRLSQAIVENYDFSIYDHIIEFGGGYGRLAITLAKRYPRLKVTIADLPAVCDGARVRIDAVGLGSRIECLPVDFFCSDLPTGTADLILFVRVLHDWNDDEVTDLTTKTRSCLRTPGEALVVEPMIDEKVNSNPSSVLTSLMLTLFGGRRRSVQEYIGILRSAGYTRVSWRDCGLSIYKIVVAHI